MSAARIYLKQIFCRHSHKLTTTWCTLEEGFVLRFKTKTCKRCNRHFRVDS